MKRIACFLLTAVCCLMFVNCSKVQVPEKLSVYVPADTQYTTEETHTPAASEVPTAESILPLMTEPVEPEDPTELYLKDRISKMTLYEKVCQMIMLAPEQIGADSTEANEKSAAALDAMPVGGMIFFKNNLSSAEQTEQMLLGLQEQSAIPMFMALDEEGGRVSRAGKNPAMGVTLFPAMRTIQTTEEAYQVGYVLAQDLTGLGFNLDFAPVADVDSNPENPVIGDRAFSDEPDTAAELVASCVNGFQDGGMLCTLKHFPGHGDTSKDTHAGTAEIGKTREELEKCELVPFAAGIEAGAPFVMVAHISLPNVTAEIRPASLSAEICQTLLRDEMGFRGIVITDSMSMRAITDHYSAEQAAVLAVQAGVDILLMPKDPIQAVEGIVTAVNDGTIPEERINDSVYRILMQKAQAGLIQTNMQGAEVQ